MRIRSDQSGQAIVIFAFALLLVGIMTFFTMATGNRIQEKIKVQATADSAAYGLAVAQARTMNVMALANRAIVAEYVSGLSVAGHISWMNNYIWTFKEQKTLWEQLHQQVVNDCALYTGCHEVCSGGVCVSRRNPACAAPVIWQCKPLPPFRCDYYDCLATACLAENLPLWKKIEDGWYSDWAPASYTSMMSRWDPNPDGLQALSRLATQWVAQAKDARVQGQRAYKEYYDLLDRSRFTHGVARNVDPRMTEGRSVTGSGGPLASATTTMSGAMDNLQHAIQVWPNDTGLTPGYPGGNATQIADNQTPGFGNNDFDVFNEILTGTRGAGNPNLPGANCSHAGTVGNNDKMGNGYTCWQTRHGWGPGYFEQNVPVEAGICHGEKGSVQYSSGGRDIVCSSSWDDPNVAQDDPGSTVPTGAQGYVGGGGSEMMMQGGFSPSGVLAANTSNDHLYADGTDDGEGGQTALSAVDVDYTTASFDITPNGPPANSIGYGNGYSNPITGVCHSITRARKDVYYQKTDGNGPGCVRYTTPASDDANNNVVYRGNCPGQDTEIGFFRFDIHGPLDSGGGPGSGGWYPNGLSSNYPLMNKKDPYDPIDIFNQPFTYASTQLDATVDQNGNKLSAWNFDFGRVGGSLLSLDQKNDESGQPRQTNGGRDGTNFTGGNRGFNSYSYKYVRGFAAGQTYYHNPKFWSEVPNLWNPYWRAKLAPPGACALASLKDISDDDVTVGKALGYDDGVQRCRP